MATKDLVIETVTPVIKSFFHQKRGYAAGIIISLVLAIAGIILGIILGQVLSWLMSFGKLNSAAYFSPTLWMSVMLYLGFAWMIFESGKYTAEKNSQAVLSFFGTRLFEGTVDDPQGLVQGDGFNWYLPPWLAGGVELVNMKSFPVDLGVEREFNSADDFPMRISTDLELGVENPFRWLTKQSPLQSTIDESVDQLRFLIGNMTSEDFKDKEQKKVLSERWRKGDPDGAGDAKGLEQEIAQWGYKVYKAQIGNIRPPREIEDANANKQVEKAQAEAEQTEIDHVTRLISSLAGGANISAELAADVIQTERGKAKRLIVSGGASDLVKAGALVSGLLQEGEPTPVPFPPGGRGSNTKKRN